MKIKITYDNGQTGTFGPVSSAEACDQILIKLAGAPNVKSAEREG